VPSGPGNAGGLNNSGNDPSGVGNASNLASPQSPGTNSAGTAQSSGGTANTQPGVTTGAGGGGSAPGANVTPQQSRQERDDTEAAIHREDEAIDRKVKGICRGC
jgi:hypothetical protein